MQSNCPHLCPHRARSRKVQVVRESTAPRRAGQRRAGREIQAESGVQARQGSTLGRGAGPTQAAVPPRAQEFRRKLRQNQRINPDVPPLVCVPRPVNSALTETTPAAP